MFRLRPTLDESQPIFQQIADMLRNDIVEGRLQENKKVPSENEISDFYNINRATVRKGLQVLVEEDVIYKKRGIGMFVVEGAREKLLNERKNQYRQDYIKPLLEEANRLGISLEAVMKLIQEEEGK